MEGPSYLARVTGSPNLGQVIAGLGLRDNGLSTGLHGEDGDSRYACALEEVTAVRLFSLVASAEISVAYFSGAI